MIIILHVLIALMGIVSTTYGYFQPNKNNLRVSYLFVALTFISGFYLVMSEPAQMIRACTTGLGYLAVVSFGIFATRRKLASMQNEKA